jgi:hypothetical protein
LTRQRSPGNLQGGVRLLTQGLDKGRAFIETTRTSRTRGPRCRAYATGQPPAPPNEATPPAEVRRWPPTRPCARVSTGSSEFAPACLALRGVQGPSPQRRRPSSAFVSRSSAERGVLATGSPAAAGYPVSPGPVCIFSERLAIRTFYEPSLAIKPRTRAVRDRERNARRGNSTSDTSTGIASRFSPVRRICC